MLRLIRNLIEDILHPRPGFVVEVNGRRVKGKLLSLGDWRDLTRCGAWAAVDALSAQAPPPKGSNKPRPPPMPDAELADCMDRAALVAARGLRRPLAWVMDHLTKDEVFAVVAIVGAVSTPNVKEIKRDPPA
jgi:hypothetical protein